MGDIFGIPVFDLESAADPDNGGGILPFAQFIKSATLNGDALVNLIYEKDTMKLIGIVAENNSASKNVYIEFGDIFGTKSWDKTLATSEKITLNIPSNIRPTFVITVTEKGDMVSGFTWRCCIGN